MPVPDPQLDDLAAAHDVLSLYLFGSRAGDGLAVLEGKTVLATGSDLDIGVVFRLLPVHHHRLASLQVALEDRFAPLRVDLVPLQRVDVTPAELFGIVSTDLGDLEALAGGLRRSAARLSVPPEK